MVQYCLVLCCTLALGNKILIKKTLNFNWYLVTSQIATYSLSLVFVIIITDLYKCGKYFVARRDQAKTADIYLIKLFIALTSQTCLLQAKQCSAAQSSSSFIHIKNIFFCLNVFCFFLKLLCHFLHVIVCPQCVLSTHLTPT